MIVTSGVQADKAGSVLHLYNRASNGARALLEIWNARVETRAPSLADALTSSHDAASRLRQWIKESAHADFTVSNLERRLDHFINETARAPLARAAFDGGDRNAIGHLAADSQREAAHLLGNQIPETILLTDLARQFGAFAASSFGAGFGGSVWALVSSADARQFGADWVAAYQQAVPAIDTVPWFIARPGPSATAVAVD